MFENAPLRVRPPHLRWRVVPVPPGETLAGWLAGPQVTVDVHWDNGASKPCRKLITRGRLLCSCDKEPRSVRTIGYVPIITPEREQLVIIVSATVAASVESFLFGVPIQFMRSKRAKTPLRVRAADAGHFNKASTEAFMSSKPRDIKPYLLHLWGDEVLCRHLATAPDASKIEVPSTPGQFNTETALGAGQVAPDNGAAISPAPGEPRRKRAKAS